MNHRRRCWIVLGICVGVSSLLLLLGPLDPPRLYFSLVGPGDDWGSGVTEALPPSPPLSVPEWVRESCRREMPPPVAKMPDVPGLVAKPFDSDVAENLGMAVVLTRSIPREAGEQHIYYRLAADALWRNGRVPTHVDLHEVALFCAEPDAVILASRWNSWYPYSENYQRYRASQIDLELRCQFAIYRFDPKTHQIRFLFPGHELRPSPDRRRVAYLTSLNGAGPRYHTIWVYDMNRKQPAPVLSFWIAAWASVWSVDYEWSADSRVLRITGDADGFARRGPRRTRKVDMAYVADTGNLYDLEQ